MLEYLLKVEKEFDPQRKYGFKIRPQYSRVLSILKKGETVNPGKFIKAHQSKFTRKNSFQSARAAIYHAFTVGKKIGVLRVLSEEKRGVPISYEKFCRLETISYFMRQIRGPKYKNIPAPKDAGTNGTYGRRLWNFNTWLHEREFEYTSEVLLENDTFKKKKVKVKLKGLEHFLEMYQNSYKSEKDFVKMIKTFLLDPMFDDCRANTLKIMYNAIKSYFEKNDSPLNFKFDYKARHVSLDEQEDLPTLTLDELMELLTVGKPTIVQKAVFLCQFHRGLDISTLVDRFNFDAWDQIVEEFGTDDYKKWDLSKCPIRVKLTRIKTTCSHTGFLDRDAIESIQKYLDHRIKQTDMPMKPGKPIFLNEKGFAINDDWVKASFRKIRSNAGLESLLDGYNKVNRYKVSDHEFRDLLKSTLIDCGVRSDLADHFIGHKPKDSYEKQATLYPKSLRREYIKASKRLNIFSNFSNYVKGYEDIEEVQQEINQLKENEKVYIETQKTILEMLKEKGSIPT